jgi:hypothetical protein
MGKKHSYHNPEQHCKKIIVQKSSPPFFSITKIIGLTHNKNTYLKRYLMGKIARPLLVISRPTEPCHVNHLLMLNGICVKSFTVYPP